MWYSYMCMYVDIVISVSDVDYTDKVFDFDAHNEVYESSDDSEVDDEGIWDSFSSFSHLLWCMISEYIGF